MSSNNAPYERKLVVEQSKTKARSRLVVTCKHHWSWYMNIQSTVQEVYIHTYIHIYAGEVARTSKEIWNFVRRLLFETLYQCHWIIYSYKGIHGAVKLGRWWLLENCISARSHQRVSKLTIINGREGEIERERERENDGVPRGGRMSENSKMAICRKQNVLINSVYLWKRNVRWKKKKIVVIVIVIFACTREIVRAALQPRHTTIYFNSDINSRIVLNVPWEKPMFTRDKI